MTGLEALAMAGAVVAAALGQGQDKGSAWTLTQAVSVDTYLTQASDRPPVGGSVPVRQFDTRDRSPRLAALRLDVSATSPCGRFGVSLSPWVGDNADLLADLDPDRPALLRSLAEGTLAFRDPKAGFSLEVGKFASWIGSESLDNSGNDLLTRGLLYTVAQPVWHTGAGASVALSPRLGATAFAVTGWNQTSTTGDRLGFGAQVRYDLGQGRTLAVGSIHSEEGGDAANRLGSFGGAGFANAGRAQIDLVDLIYVQPLGPATRLTVNGDYGSGHGTAGSGTWGGLSLTARHELTPRLALAVRAERVFDHGGLRLGQSADVSSVTLGASYRLDPRVALRLDLRRDWADRDLFTLRERTASTVSTATLGLTARF